MAQSRRDKRNVKRSRLMRFGLPQTLMEIFAIPLILFVMSNPTFGTKDFQLPSLFVSESPPQASDMANPSPYELEIRSDGTVYCEGEETDVDAVAGRTEQDLKADQGIRLLVETGADATCFMQVQAQLSSAGLWERVRIPHTSRHPGQDSGERRKGP